MFIRTASFAVAATLSVVTLSAVTTTFPAYASDDKAPEISVGYADLDLSTKAGHDALRSRVSKAAAKVCRKMNLDNPGDQCRSALTRSTLATIPAATVIAAR